MIDNTREHILLKLIGQIESISTVKRVQRRRPTSEEFKQMSDHQLPFVAIEAMGPQPVKLVQEARKGFGKTLVHHFSMTVDFYVYARWVVDQDSEFGALYDDIYRALYAESLLKGLADKILTEPVPVPSIIMEPYHLFRVRSKVVYRTQGGI
jgi:hypothetical protein